MKATEIRIGNLAMSRNGEVTLTAEDIKYVSECGSGFTVRLTPIPITEEWLLKFGFEQYKDSFWFKDEEDFTYYIHGNNVSRLYKIKEKKTTPTFLATIDFVHQLQNLYFALTGEELLLLK